MLIRPEFLVIKIGNRILKGFTTEEEIQAKRFKKTKKNKGIQ